MKCESCNIVVGSEFIHAIKSNQCPACGKSIMQQAKLASYLSLRALLEDNVKGINAETIALLIVANFELKQLFKEGLQKSSEEGIIEVDEEDPDAEFKEKQKQESKDILEKMRDEALNGALKDKYGFGDENEVLLDPENTGMHEIVNSEKQRQKQQVIASELRGNSAFNRSE